MSFNSVCNHTRDKQIGLPLRVCPILLSLVWLQTELDSTQSCYHYLSITEWSIFFSRHYCSQLLYGQRCTTIITAHALGREIHLCYVYLVFRPLMLIVQKVIYIAFNLHDGKLINISLMWITCRKHFLKHHIMPWQARQKRREKNNV